MSEQTIDKLNIEINTKAKDNADGLDKLAANIQRLKSSVGAGVDKLSGISASLSKLGSAITDLKGKSGTLSSLVNSMKRLNELKTDHVAGNISTLTASLKTLGGMDPELKTMISDLSALARSGNGGVAENALSLQAAAAKAQATIDKSALTSAKAQEGLAAIAEKNKQIEDSARAAAAQEQELTDSINRVIQEHVAQNGSVGAFSSVAANIGSVTPSYTEETPILTQAALSGSHTSYNMESSIRSLKEAVGEVGGAATAAASEVASGSRRATGFVDKLKQSFSSVKDRVVEFESSTRSAFRLQNLYGAYFILRRIASVFGGWISNINSYIENMNLFNVAMGTGAEQGQKLANSLQNVLGVDAGDAMRYMGLFQQLTTSFGAANSQATTMSKNLTELGYDISSFFNIPISESFEKLESGITGQTRAMRSIGVDVSQARLQQELYNMGIKESVKNLSQADKSILRYKAIMEQTTNAQGDMARTIQTPANALRVLTAQLQIAGRAIGSIFIPALEAILPVVTAVVEVIGDLASEIASLLGFKMPTIDYSSLKNVATGADDAADAVSNIGNNAAKSAKQVNNLISGFDELNILQTDSNDSAATGAGTGTNGNILSGIDLPSYDALKNAVSNNIDGLKKKIKGFLEAFRADPLTTFSNALLGVNGAFGELGVYLSKLDYADALNGITAAIIGFGLTKNPILALAIGAVATAMSHLFPEKSKIDLLDGSLIALGGALVLKTFTGMPFKLAFGISALLESGLIVLIGKNDAINLLTSTLTGLGTGMLAFSFTGNLPLAVGIGLVSTAISALAIHFSDMQIAPVLLSGVATGLFAVKLGMDSWSAGAVGLGVAITSFAELNNISPELRTGLLGISGAVTALGLAFQVGFGPEGLIIAAVAGAFIGLGAGIIQASEDAKKADLESRFGSIKLSASKVEDVAKRLTATPWTVKIDAAIDANNKIKDLEKNVESDIETLNKMNWKISVGMQLTKGEISDYKQTISSFISDAKSYIQQRQYSVTLAINASFAPGSDTQKNLLQFVNSYYGGAQKQLDSLGKQLSDEVNKAFSDGILTEGEYLKISNIEQKMQKIIDKISDAEYKAKLDNLTADISNKGLTADSFEDLQTQIQKTAQDRLTKADQVRLKAKAVAELKLNEDGNKAEYNKAISEAQEYYNQQKATIDLTGLDVSLNTVNSKFSSELKSAQPIWSSGVKEAMSNGWKIGIDSSKGTYTTSISDLINGVSGSYQKELNDMEKSGKISSAARQNIASLVSELQPTETDLKQIAASATSAGESVPSNVAKGISDIEQMKAVGDDTQAINYMIGKNLSTDSTFINTLATVKDAGKNVDSNVAQGLADNIQLVKNKSGETIIGIKDTVTGKTLEITPALKQNLSDLGLNMSNSLVKSVNDNTPKVKTAAENMSKGALKGAQDQLQEDKQSWLDWAIWPWNWFKEKNEIHSPSKLFEGGGQNIVQGLWDGMSSKWNDFMSWWKGLHIPTPHFKFGMESLDNYDNFVAKAAKKLGLKEIPKVDIDWYASGGAFSSAGIIGVGEYPNASTNPEVVAPQSIIRETVEESNEGLAAALIAAAQQIVEAIEKKETTVEMDGEKVTKNVNKRNANRGYNLGLQST